MDELNSFFQELKQELAAGAMTENAYELEQFMSLFSYELEETGFSEGFEFCYFSARGIRVDGFWFDEEGCLDLYVADFEQRNELETLTKTELKALFNRLENFVNQSVKKDLADNLEITSPSYSLAISLENRFESLRKVRFIICSERVLSERVKDTDLNSAQIFGVPVSFHVWDLGRLFRLKSAKNQKEPLEFDFLELFDQGISGVAASINSEDYQSYLLIVPGNILADLYESYGARLLEQNVRTFLQARGNVNKGLRATILNEPEMFFAYNNGLTATAQEVEVQESNAGLIINKIKDLQIVNGGQTTASLFHTRYKDKADLSKVFVQMKLSVISSEKAEEVVPKISEYANTQNRVNAADFFSNHPFHIRMEEFSRRMLAPASADSQFETKWFYERARGQYADAQTTMTSSEKKKFKLLHPTNQKFTKTDLAKFENVWDDHPMWVNRGAQRNFSEYATRIGKEWEKNADQFNEHYFKRAIARAIFFRTTEKLVSAQDWYERGYRANIVAYTLAVLSAIIGKEKKFINYNRVWSKQELSPTLMNVLEVISKEVYHDIKFPPHGISNISEWCKKKECWSRLKEKIEYISSLLPEIFFVNLVSLDYQKTEEKQAKKVQKIDDGIVMQSKAVAISGGKWQQLYSAIKDKDLLTSKETGVLKIAMQIPSKIPSEAQSVVLMEILAKAYDEGIQVN